VDCVVIRSARRLPNDRHPTHTLTDRWRLQQPSRGRRCPVAPTRCGRVVTCCPQLVSIAFAASAAPHTQAVMHAACRLLQLLRPLSRGDTTPPACVHTHTLLQVCMACRRSGACSHPHTRHAAAGSCCCSSQRAAAAASLASAPAAAAAAAAPPAAGMDAWRCTSCCCMTPCCSVHHQAALGPAAGAMPAW
jgi:hypothetical protein